jgi:hypothetical protein
VIPAQQIGRIKKKKKSKFDKTAYSKKRDKLKEKIVKDVLSQVVIYIYVLSICYDLTRICPPLLHSNGFR